MTDPMDIVTEAKRAIAKADGRLLEIAHVAHRLSVSQETVRRYIRSGRLHAIRLHTGYLRVSEHDLGDYIRSLQQPTTTDNNSHGPMI